MKRVAAVIRLRPEKEAEYLALHANAWPQVLATLTAAHVTNYSIFLRDGLLFSYFEYLGDDLETDMGRIAADETTRRWWTFTDPCQEPMPGIAAGWASMAEVFHLD